MKARRLILTAGVVVALAGPAAQTAGAQLPLGGGGSRPLEVALKEMKATVHQNKQAKSSATAINASTYSAYAYVQGGASQKVGKAITKAGKAALHQNKQAKSSATAINAGAYGAYAYVQGGASQKVGKAITKAGKKLATAHPRPVGEPAVRGGSTGSIGGTGSPVPEGGPDACAQSSICTPQELCTIWGMGCLILEQPGPAIEVAASSAQLPATDSTDSTASDSSDATPALLGADSTDTSSLYQDC